MEEKTFQTGLLVGRFQHIHQGHEKLIQIGLSICKRLLIFIGSSNCQKSLRNPYDFSYRKQLLEMIYHKEIEQGRILIAPLEDFKDVSEMSSRWGNYVISSAETLLQEKLECIMYGKDKNIFKCFDKKTVQDITEILVNRNDSAISATRMREYLIANNKEEWEKYANASIYPEYETLRTTLLNTIEEER